MNSSDGIIYCPARVDPYSHVQVADFTKVQFLEINNSDDEAENGTSPFLCMCLYIYI